MRVLHVIAALSPRYGGPSKACVEMATAVAKRGHDVHVFTTDQDGRGRLSDTAKEEITRNCGARITFFPATLRVGWPISIGLLQAIRRRISSFDVAHIHSLYLSHGAVAGHYCRKFGVPYILRPHGTLDPYIRERNRWRKSLYEFLIERKNFDGASGIHYTAEEEFELAQGYVGRHRKYVVPLGVYPEQYVCPSSLESFKATLGQSIHGRKIALFLGRLNFKKGLDVLAHSLCLLLKKLPNVCLIVAGPDDGYKSTFVSMARTLGIADRVVLTGMLLGEQKLAAFATADVFVLPSYTENFGISVVEAMAMGVPVVISDKVNIWREIQNAGAGLVAKCDPDQFAHSMEKVLTDDKLAEAMAVNAKKLVADRFNWEAIGNALEGMYQDVAAAKD